MCYVTIDDMNTEQSTCEKPKEATQEWMIETIGEHDLFKFLGNKNNPQNVKNLKLHSDFDVIFEKFRNLSTRKMRVCCTHGTVNPKHVLHFHLKNSVFCRKLT